MSRKFIWTCDTASVWSVSGWMIGLNPHSNILLFAQVCKTNAAWGSISLLTSRSYSLISLLNFVLLFFLYQNHHSYCVRALHGGVYSICISASRSSLPLNTSWHLATHPSIRSIIFEIEKQLIVKIRQNQTEQFITLAFAVQEMRIYTDTENISKRVFNRLHKVSELLALKQRNSGGINISQNGMKAMATMATMAATSMMRSASTAQIVDSLFLLRKFIIQKIELRYERRIKIDTRTATITKQNDIIQ